MRQLRNILIIFFLALGFSGLAQNHHIDAAYNFAQQRQFDSARVRIEEGMKDPRAVNDAQAWYICGFIYKELYKRDEGNNGRSPLRIKSLEAFKKSIVLDTAERLKSENLENIRTIGKRFHNDAVKNLDTANFPISIENFNQYIQILKTTDPGVDFKSKQVEFWLAIATTYTSKYQADRKVNKVFMDSTKRAYERVLSLDPNNVSANYSLGILYYNEAVYLIKEMEYDVDLTILGDIQDNSVQLFKQSLPFALKAHELQPDREETIIALSGIYFGLNEMEKHKAFEEMLKKIKNPEQKDK